MAATTLSQIRAWSTQHLTDAAGYWSKTADQWDDAFLQMRNQSHSIAWKGAGGDALRQRTTSDLSTVSSRADQLRQAAGIARNGASDISAAQRSVLNAVSDAENAGFDVGEDLSVSYTDHGGTPAQQAALQAQAETMASEIWSRAKQLDGTEVKVAGQLTAATTGLGNATFAHNGKGSGIRLVDNTQGGDSNGGIPQLPRHDPPAGRWDGPPPPGWHPGTGYWTLDPDHPADSPNGLPDPSLYQSGPPCVRPDLLTGGSTGVTSIGGGSDNPQKAKAWGIDLQGTSKVRVSGTEFNGITKAVQINGRWYQAQWQEYQYELNTIPVVQGVGGPFGDLTMPDMSQAHTWKPVTLGQLMQTSTVYPEATIHLPDLNGGSIDIKNGWWAGGLPSTGIPTPPVMTRGN
ncbi:hypothetical protein [Mycobacterium sp. 852002-40037_SCH5390672]|uniref:hypothetical protein n=1 Tax=Mycobacterium sp. 852002-40037_SCH5390672 TaxID=1834089 RepID=UPI000A637BF9|nr:hypothetical protein [Mycobacterium sp. 852002-40037_SCH5390672]